MNNNTIEWDLSGLYSGPHDPKVTRDTASANRLADDFVSLYRGNIGEKTAPTQLRDALKRLEKILEQAARPEMYASLLFSTDVNNQAFGALLNGTTDAYVQISKKLLFFELDLAKLSEKTLNRFASDPSLKNYRHFILRQIDYKKHRLTEPEEKLLADKDQTSKAAFARLFEQLISSKKFLFRKNSKKEITLSETEILDLLHNPDRETRKAAARDFTLGLKDEVPKLSFIYNTLGFDKKINDGYRKFENPEDSRHLDNEVTTEAVDALVGSVTKNYGMVADYYRFKAKTLQVGKLKDYDRYAPTAKSSVKIPFVKGKDIILDAFGEFDPEFRSIAKEFFDSRWIHASLKPGKRGGAYCSYLTPSLHPYVFVNYQDKIADVETLAHELGHAIHGYLMRSQTLLNFDSPLTLAETASVFAEMIVFDYLKQSLPPKERLALLMRTIEGLIASVFRQIAMFQFERDFHALRRNGEITHEKISELWLNRQKEMFKGSIELTPDYALWWSYIPHFFETPFYVYAYAFGQLLTMSLYERRNEPGFKLKYKDFLRSGGSKSPRELLAGLGVDTADPDFWQNGLNLIGKMVAEAKETYASLKADRR
ncbi:MAG: M3 family oligoendopeptidase [Candidatus Saccharibacteria bacterium]